ncbi:hypothetical protein V8F20_008794 [Naviculisporaceae sp. PSN 640]
MSAHPSVAHDASYFQDPENPSLDELRLLGYQFLKPGKQCPHPVHTWFRNPRPPPPSRPAPARRSRRAILSQIYREHTTAPPSRINDVLAHYIPREDPDPPADDVPKFTLFPLLPPEIRQQIWELAIPSRSIDLRELRHNRQYTSIQYAAPLPVPHIARVCREARAVVFRLGCRLRLLSAPSQAAADSNDIKKYRRHCVGFFMRGIDVPLYLPDFDAYNEPEYVRSVVKDTGGFPVEEVELTRSALTKTMKCKALALSVPDLIEAFGSKLFNRKRRHPVNAYRPSSSAGARGKFEEAFIDVKNTLATPGSSLNTVYVYHKSRFIDVYMLVDKDFSLPNEHKEPQEPPYETEIQLLVDLYDDETLSELASLETLHLDGGNESPRYATPGAANPGLCLNCERVQWETRTKPQVEAVWLQMHGDELEDDENLLEEIVNGNDPISFDKDHPWVKEKLKNAPEFRSAVLIHLKVAEQALLRKDEEEQEDWANLNWRIQAIR